MDHQQVLQCFGILNLLYFTKKYCNLPSSGRLSSHRLFGVPSLSAIDSDANRSATNLPESGSRRSSKTNLFKNSTAATLSQQRLDRIDSLGDVGSPLPDDMEFDPSGLRMPSLDPLKPIQPKIPAQFEPIPMPSDMPELNDEVSNAQVALRPHPLNDDDSMILGLGAPMSIGIGGLGPSTLMEVIFHFSQIRSM